MHTQTYTRIKKKNAMRVYIRAVEIGLARGYGAFHGQVPRARVSERNCSQIVAAAV